MSERRGSLLALLILTWGISWPAVKLGIATMPPLWYACARYSIGAICLFVFVGSRRALALPPRSDWPLVAVSAVLQMAAYSSLTGIALTTLPVGRVSILAYSTPLWVVPLAAWRLRERVTSSALVGLSLGIVGVFAVALGLLRAAGEREIFACALLIAAAGAWAVSIVFVRSHRFTTTPLALAPWQMLVAASLLLPMALLVEGTPPSIDARAAASLAYVGPVATGFAYWAVVEAGRHYRAATMSMALLAVPSVGTLISALALGETIDASLVAGTLLIGVGIRLVTAPHGRSRAAAQSRLSTRS